MSPSSKQPQPLDARVNQVLQEFLERIDRGETVDREQFLADHADLADQLRSFIADSEDLTRRAARVDQAEVSTNQSLSETIAPASLSPGPTLSESFGRYRLRRVLGRGAMGAVYLAQDTQLDRQVAIKVPNFSEDRSEELLKRFYFEARAAAMLRNAHICPVYDVGEIDGQHYISMAYIEGCPLSEVIRTKGPQPERQVLLLIRKLALALQEAHDRGVIHRDLKPGNVMVDRRGEPVVMDFGLACQTREASARITVSGVILGSPAYMSPEQLEGISSKISPSADQYALGVILYELLTGQLPFRGSISAVISQIVTTPAPSARALRTDLDPRVDQLCLKMMSKSAADRFSSMKAVADRVTAILKEPVKPGSSEPTGAAGNPSPKSGNAAPAAVKPKGPESTSDQESADSTDPQKRIATLCIVAAKLIRKHDYAQAREVLLSVPAAQRSDELTELLGEAEEKEEEAKALLKDIEIAIRRNQSRDLPTLIKRYLQLKPGNKAMQELAKDLQQYGAEQVIKVRQAREHFLDPAGKIWNPWHVAAYVAGLALVCGSVYLAAVAFQTPNGTVVVEVHDPRVVVTFANDEITADSSGKKFKLKTTDKKTLQMEVDGVTIDSLTQEISVSRNETKLISARLIDGQLDLLIDSRKQSFPVPDRSASAKSKQPGAGEAMTSREANGENWLDLLESFDVDKASVPLAKWKREGDHLTGTVDNSKGTIWSIFVPTQELHGDYDLEIGYRITGSSGLQLGLPLSDTKIVASINEKGAGFPWIDGKEIEVENLQSPLGTTKARFREQALQTIIASVRHSEDDATVDFKLDGIDAGRYSGPRSRLLVPKNNSRPHLIKLVVPFIQGKNPHALEIHKARVRILPSNGTPVPSKPVDPPEVAVTETPTPVPQVDKSPSANVLLDIDFRNSDGGFTLADDHHILSEHKDGEYRYLGKKPGWWYNALHPEFWKRENNQLRDFIVEFDLRIVSKKKGVFALEFGQSGENTLSLCLNERGEVLLMHGVDELLAPMSSPAMRPVDQFNTLRLVVENKTAKVSVNGTPLFEKKLERYAGGTISFWLGPEEVPFDTRVRRFRLERIGPKPPTWTNVVRHFKGHTDTVRAVAFLPDGKQAVSCGHDKTFKLWNVDTGELLHDFTTHPDVVTSLSVSADGRRALTGCWDSQVRLWDLENRTLLKTLKGHAVAIGGVVISKDGQTGLSCSNDGVIRQWDLKTGRSKIIPGPAPDGVVAMNAAENVVASGSGEGTIILRNRLAMVPLLGHEPGFVEGLAFTPDGSRLVSGGDDGTVRIWDLQEGKEVHRFVTDGVGFDTVAVTNNGRYVIAGSSDHKIMGWDLQTGDTVMTIHADLPVTHRLALSPDNQFILSAGGNKSWRLMGDFDLRLWKVPAPVAPEAESQQ